MIPRSPLIRPGGGVIWDSQDGLVLSQPQQNSLILLRHSFLVLKAISSQVLIFPSQNNCSSVFSFSKNACTYDSPFHQAKMNLLKLWHWFSGVAFTMTRSPWWSKQLPIFVSSVAAVLTIFRCMFLVCSSCTNQNETTQCVSDTFYDSEGAAGLLFLWTMHRASF